MYVNVHLIDVQQYPLLNVVHFHVETFRKKKKKKKEKERLE